MSTNKPVYLTAEGLQKIKEEIEYLMIRGLTRDEATAAIVRGFLRAGIEGLPPELDVEIQRAIEASEQTLL